MGKERGYKWHDCWGHVGWYLRICPSSGIFTLSQPSVGFQRENGPKREKYPVSSSRVEESASSMSEVRGGWADLFETAQ